MKRILLLLLMVLLLTACGAPAEMPREGSTVHTDHIEDPQIESKDPLEKLFDGMSVEEKVGQLFLVAAPTYDIEGEMDAYHFGGLVLFSQNVDGHSRESFTKSIENMQRVSEVPLLIAVDEEGGTVCRISSDKDFRTSRFPSPRTLYADGGISLLTETETEKCQLLYDIGVNVNLAPVCDITTDPDAFMYSRSLGENPEITAQCIDGIVQVMKANGIGSVLKHFPGYGNNTDTHVAMAIDNRSLDELESVDLVPFQGGIDAGCDAIMVSHTIITAMDNQYPATLSPAVHKYLRETMGFDGVIMTDDLEMDAITDHYGRGEAAVLAVLAGNDMLCTWTYKEQYAAVLEAVQTGRITATQLNESVMRILRWKQNLGIL